MFVTAEVHAHVPTQPGGPGVLLSACNPPEWSEGIQTVFTNLPGVRQNRRARYIYAGEYELTRAEPMTVSEYASLPSETRETIALRILFHDSCKEVQKRIIPDYTRPPVSGALARERSLTITQLMRAEAGEAMETAIAAYDQGLESLNVWLLRCVSYDESLLKHISKLQNPKTSQVEAVTADLTGSNTTTV
ncbi:hypothetical protein FKP32DRAFT_127568 [Trametes sanguinea]|nr:hypothetical protein FKP32DRAFT_127568 [Trametes sanguinea]